MLSAQAQKILTEYFNLPFVGVAGVRCPYFNNARKRQRAELKVLVGKGLPEEIVEETKIISLQYHAGLFDHSGNCRVVESQNCHPRESGVPAVCHPDESRDLCQTIRKFLIDNDLGIECSGFVTNILRAHYLETKNIDIAKKFFKVSPKQFARWLITKLRPVENISARVWSLDQNTEKISDMAKITAGDVIVILEKQLPWVRNHIILITEKNGNVLKYAHARTWKSEGRFGHGVAMGEIKIIAPDKGILEQEWSELGKVGTDNETLAEAKTAKVVEVRRARV